MGNHHHNLMYRDYTCEDIAELLGAYSIGATTPEEARAVEAMLADCPEAAAELAQYLAVSDAMLYMLPLDKVPPPDLVERLHLPDAAPAPEPAAPTPPVTDTDAEAAPPPPPTPQRPSRVYVWLAAAGLAAAFVLVAGMNLIWYQMFTALQAQQTQLTSLLQQQQQMVTQVTQTLRQQPAPAAALVLTTSSTHHLGLQPATDDASGAAAQVIWDANSRVGALYASGLPAPAAGHSYQMWLVRDGQEISLGTFAVGANGEGALVFQSPVPIQPEDVIGISTEPTSGSAAPTTPHLVTGRIDT